jgi:hypothetical protein
MNTMPIATFKSPEGAQPVVDRLTKAGLHPRLGHAAMLEKLWFVSKPKCCVSLEVPANEFERSEQMLIDWDDQGVLSDAIRCPQCGSFRVQYPQFTRKSNIPNVFLGLAAEVGVVEKDFYCDDCHLTWAGPEVKPAKPRKHMAPNYFVE